jgi:hypothetical protein
MPYCVVVKNARARIGMLRRENSCLSINIARKMKMTRYRRARFNYPSNLCWVLFCVTSFAGPAVAGEKPPVLPDRPSSLTTTSRVPATVNLNCRPPHEADYAKILSR